MSDPSPSPPNEIAVLAGGLAHEIRNPLSTIGLNLELIAEALGGTEPREGDDRTTARVRRMLGTVQRECGHLSGILDAFLAFARAGEPDAEPADLNALVREFADFFRPTAEAAGVSTRHPQSTRRPRPANHHLQQQLCPGAAYPPRLRPSSIRSTEQAQRHQTALCPGP